MPSLSQQSIAYWNTSQVAWFPANVTAEQSRQAMEDRNGYYPGLLDLMPIRHPDKTIMDFGCGPGHDTIGFLLHKATHVYAVDTSWQGLTSLWRRLQAHHFEDRCTLIRVGEQISQLPRVPYIHCAGVLHHVAEPVTTLETLRQSLLPDGEIRMMVYAAESQYVADHGGPHQFEQTADGDAPIARAWTRRQVRAIAGQAGLHATHLGDYGEGLNSCWSLKE